LHEPRQACVSHLVMARVDLTTVKELFGHKDIGMTLRHEHRAPAREIRAVEILDNVLDLSTIQNYTIEELSYMGMVGKDLIIMVGAAGVEPATSTASR
jgi:hypothetical protein